MKCIAISDTHGFHNHLKLQEADCIIHTGDATNSRNRIKNELEFITFIDWFGELPYKYKIFVAGNHDLFVELNKNLVKEICKEKNIIYLEDESIIIEGIKFYGTPWVPQFFNWSFMASERKLESIYAAIEEDTQVLLTHGPAEFILDNVGKNRGHVGSESLALRIDELKNLKVHCFGHIHEDKGEKYRNEVLHINAANIEDLEGTVFEI